MKKKLLILGIIFLFLVAGKVYASCFNCPEQRYDFYHSQGGVSHYYDGSYETYDDFSSSNYDCLSCHRSYSHNYHHANDGGFYAQHHR